MRRFIPLFLSYKTERRLQKKNAQNRLLWGQNERITKKRRASFGTKRSGFPLKKTLETTEKERRRGRRTAGLSPPLSRSFPSFFSFPGNACHHDQPIQSTPSISITTNNCNPLSHHHSHHSINHSSQGKEEERKRKQSFFI